MVLHYFLLICLGNECQPYLEGKGIFFCSCRNAGISKLDAVSISVLSISLSMLFASTVYFNTHSLLRKKQTKVIIKKRLKNEHCHNNFSDTCKQVSLKSNRFWYHDIKVTTVDDHETFRFHEDNFHDIDFATFIPLQNVDVTDRVVQEMSKTGQILRTMVVHISRRAFMSIQPWFGHLC